MSSESVSRNEVDDAPDPRDDPGAWIRANEEWLRKMANSDHEGAWVYKRLLHSEGLEA